MNHNSKRSIALYNQLSPKQLATVAAGIHDANELKILGGTVERKTYRMMDAAFLDWNDWFFKVSTILGMAYWQAKASHLTMLGATHQLSGHDLDEREQAMAEEIVQTIPLTRTNMKAALEAMRQLVEQHGFKFADALHLADIGQHEVEDMSNIEPNEERLEWFLNELGSSAPNSG